MRKSLKILPLLLVVSLTACNNLTKKIAVEYYFHTEINYTLYAAKNNVMSDIRNICKAIDSFSDPYQKRNIASVYDLNHSLTSVEISEGFYDLLESVKEAQKVAKSFNPLIGSLSDKWKESLGKDIPEVLSSEVITEELAKINSSTFTTNKEKDESKASGYKYTAQINGDAKMDLGAIVKGYALDRIYDYLKTNQITDYLINAGSSSILLGTNEHTKTWFGPRQTYYTVSLRDVPNVYFKARDCVISSSGNDIQGVKIGNTVYSHIINPSTGSAIMENDAVIVITDPATGYLGDALSTSLMMNTVEEIKAIEKEVGAKTIVVKDKKIAYSHPDIEFI